MRHASLPAKPERQGYVDPFRQVPDDKKVTGSSSGPDGDTARDLAVQAFAARVYVPTGEALEEQRRESREAYEAENGPYIPLRDRIDIAEERQNKRLANAEDRKWRLRKLADGIAAPMDLGVDGELGPKAEERISLFEYLLSTHKQGVETKLLRSAIDKLLAAELKRKEADRLEAEKKARAERLAEYTAHVAADPARREDHAAKKVAALEAAKIPDRQKSLVLHYGSIFAIEGLSRREGLPLDAARAEVVRLQTLAVETEFAEPPVMPRQRALLTAALAWRIFEIPAEEGEATS